MGSSPVRWIDGDPLPIQAPINNLMGELNFVSCLALL